VKEIIVILPWWKQLWPWLLILGPSLAMLGCIITIYLALTMHVDQPLTQDIVKVGLKIVELKK
jgi:hypothetical protein